jgi:hypothetical protein
MSSATGRRYPLTMICAVFRGARSTVYRTMTPAISAPPVAAKRGPKPRWSDAEVVGAIRAVRTDDGANSQTSATNNRDSQEAPGS